MIICLSFVITYVIYNNLPIILLQITNMLLQMTKILLQNTLPRNQIPYLQRIKIIIHQNINWWLGPHFLKNWLTFTACSRWYYMAVISDCERASLLCLYIIVCISTVLTFSVYFPDKRCWNYSQCLRVSESESAQVIVAFLTFYSVE